MSILDTLITDRTAADVAAMRKKGAYDYTDLNRVTEAMEFVHARPQAYGYADSYSPVRIRHQDGTEDLRWREDDELMNVSLFAAYRANVAALREALPLGADTPETPQSVPEMTWDGANAIEKILQDLDLLLAVVQQSYFYSGEIYAGEV